MRYTVEHFRAIDGGERPLGVAYVPTGRVDQVDAHDPPAAAAIALSGEAEVLEDVDVVSYDPGGRPLRRRGRGRGREGSTAS